MTFDIEYCYAFVSCLVTAVMLEIDIFLTHQNF